MKRIRNWLSFLGRHNDIKTGSTSIDITEVTQDIPYKEVSLGYMTIYLFSKAEIERGQVGYSIDENGSPLTGTRKGDWRENWVVIGYEDVCGDPIFVDVKDPARTVYTARHGEGRWDPKIISTSLNNFIVCLGYILELSVDRNNPVELERNPIADAKRDQVLSLIAKQNQGISIEFWANWLDD